VLGSTVAEENRKPLPEDGNAPVAIGKRFLPVFLWIFLRVARNGADGVLFAPRLAFLFL